jgi:multidrug/hemolysin transport system permease protein
MKNKHFFAPVGVLIKRNLLLYFRNLNAVFFSLLSMLIVILLMVLFLGNMNVDNLIGALNTYGNGDEETLRSQAKDLILLWEIAGILVVNSVMISLTMIGTVVADRTEGKLAIFLTAPISKIQIALGYVLSSVLVGVIMCTLTYVISMTFYVVQGGTMPGIETIVEAAPDMGSGITSEIASGRISDSESGITSEITSVLMVHIKMLGLIVLNCCLYSSLMYLLVIFIKNSSAWSGLGSIIGTLVGFLGGIYLPMGMLPSAVGNVLKCLPILHGVALSREVLMSSGLTALFGNMPEVVAGYDKAMGIQLFVNQEVLPPWISVVFLGLCGIIALIAAALLQRRGRA